MVWAQTSTLPLILTHQLIEVHDTSSLGVDRHSILITRDKVQREQSVTIVYLRAKQLLQFLQLVLHWERKGKLGLDGV